jgi:hypothetical protein
MKLLQTLALASLISASGISQANPNHWNHHGPNRGYYNPYGWVAPLVIGGVVGYAITRPQTVIVQQPSVIYPNTQPQPAPYGYHYENILDANCNCYRLVLVQNQP